MPDHDNGTQRILNNATRHHFNAINSTQPHVCATVSLYKQQVDVFPYLKTRRLCVIIIQVQI